MRNTQTQTSNTQKIENPDLKHWIFWGAHV
jgi:hypothetical protein